MAHESCPICKSRGLDDGGSLRKVVSDNDLIKGM